MWLLKLSFIGLWYYTNGLNGIATQEFAAKYREIEGEEKEILLVNAIIINIIIVCLQLGTGAFIGRLIQYFMSGVLNQWKPISEPYYGPATTLDILSIALISLHGLGSLCTNLGYFYGKAAVVQIIKLLEPFETLVFSYFLMPLETNFSLALLLSMMVVITNAIFLLLETESKAIPNTYSIVFAILSSFTLSLRNVLQRKSQRESLSKMDMTLMQRSVYQFTKLSMESLFCIIILASFLQFWLYFWPSQIPASISEILSPILKILSVKDAGVIIWHPSYNIFSTIIIGWFVALTHSLLNAGKRIFAIVMAIIWFHEEFTSKTIVYLSAIIFGGLWYTNESNRLEKTSPLTMKPSTNTRKIGKWLMIAVFMIVSFKLIENYVVDFRNFSMSEEIQLKRQQNFHVRGNG